jgi:urease accessory protein
MNKLLRAILPFGLLLLSCPAWAHSPIMGIGGVLGGMLHALLIPEHGMSLLALGVALGLQQPTASRSGVLIFAAALTAGLVVTAFIAEPALAADVLLAATGILGLLIAAAWVPPVVAWPLAVIAGVAFALDSRPEVTATDEFIRMLIGSGIGGALALAIVAAGSTFLQGNAARIVLRVLGSWIAAIAIMDLSLRMVTRFTTGG